MHWTNSDLNNVNIGISFKSSISREENVKGFCHICMVLLDFSLTVKAATLIFISGCGSAYHLPMKGNQVY